MTPHPGIVRAAHPSSRLAIAVVSLVILTVASACAAGDKRGDKRGDTARPADAQSTVGAPATSAAPPGPVDSAASQAAALVGRLLDDVVPDSALFGSWTVYPIERRVGLRLVVLDGQYLLLADSLDGYVGPTARWRIRQAQMLETPRPGEGYVASCALAGADASDGTVVARVTMSANESLAPIHAAWRLDPATWRFAPFPPDSLSCYNEGGGP